MNNPIAPEKLTIIGFVAKAPFPNLITPLTEKLLLMIVERSLEKCSILAHAETFPPVTAMSISEIMMIFVVSDLRQGLCVIKAELTATGLLESSQIAWRERSESIWMDDYPVNPPVPFEQRMAEAEKCRAQVKASADFLRPIFQMVAQSIAMPPALPGADTPPQMPTAP